MDAPSNHILKSQAVTKGAECRTESENNPAHGRAYEDAAVDMIHHHTEGDGRRNEDRTITREGMIPSN